VETVVAPDFLVSRKMLLKGNAKMKTTIYAFAVYSGDGKKILSASWDKTIKEWDSQSGQCLASYDRKTTSLSANVIRYSNILETDVNKIIIKNKSTGAVIKTLVNIPGICIHGCSFARLHPDCRLSEEERQLLKMYGAVT
jgi:WD40 repeat protein